MPDLIAYCGLNCAGCPIYTATREPDSEKRLKSRASIAQTLHDLYGMSVQAEDISDCDGCIAENGRLFFTCSTCEIRKCVRQKDLSSCAFCPDVACDKLKKLFETDAEAENRLKQMRIQHTTD